MGKKANELLKKKNKSSNESKFKIIGDGTPSSTDLKNLRMSDVRRSRGENSSLSNLTMSDVKGWNDPETTYTSPNDETNGYSGKAAEVIKKYGIDPDNFKAEDYNRWAAEHTDKANGTHISSSGREHGGSGQELSEKKNPIVDFFVSVASKNIEKRKNKEQNGNAVEKAVTDINKRIENSAYSVAQKTPGLDDGMSRLANVVPSKNASKDFIEENNILRALASNNERREGYKNFKSNAALTGFATGASSLALNLPEGDIGATEKAYKAAGLPMDKFIPSNYKWLKARQENPTASNIGDFAGGTASMVVGGEMVNEALAGLRWFQKLPQFARHTISTATLMGSRDAASTYGRTGDLKEAAKRGGVGAAAGGAFGFVNNAVGKLGENLLFNRGWQNKVAAEIIREGTAAASGAVADAGVRSILTGEDIDPVNIGTAFAFAAITHGINAVKATKASKAYLDELNNKMMSDYERMARMTPQDAAGKKRLAENVMKYNEIMRAYLSNEPVSVEVDGKLYEFDKSRARFIGQDKYVKAIKDKLDIVSTNANSVSHGIGTDIKPDASAGSTTTDMAKITTEYGNAVDNKILDFTKYARENTGDNKTSLSLSKVSERAVSDIKNITGIDTAGFTHSIKTNTIRHIDADHGINGKTDQSMSDDNDIARMQYVIDNYDSIGKLDATSKEFRDKNQNPAPMIKYEKRVNGNYYVVEAVPDIKRRQLEIVSAYKTKAAEQQTADAQAPAHVVQNASADAAYDDSVPQINADVNSQTPAVPATPTAPAATQAALTTQELTPALQSTARFVRDFDISDDIGQSIMNYASTIENRGASAADVNKTAIKKTNGMINGLRKAYGTNANADNIGRGMHNRLAFAAADTAAIDRNYIEGYADIVINVANQNGADYNFTPAQLADDVINGTRTTDNKAVTTLKNVLSSAAQNDVDLRAMVYGGDATLNEQAAAVAKGDYSFIQPTETVANAPIQQRIAQAIQSTLDMNSPETQGLIDNSRTTTGAELVPALTEYVIRNNGVPSDFSRIFTDGGAAVTAAVQNNNRGIISAAQRGAVNNDTNGSISERGNISDGDMGRAYGERAGEPRKGVYGGTGTAETGRQAETVSDSRAAFTESIRGSQFVTEHRLNSSAGEIVYNEISPEALADRADAQEIIERNAARGIDTVFFADSAHGSRGFLYRGTIYIQYNNTKYTPGEINEHEYVHTQAKTKAYETLKNAFVKRMTEEDRAGLEQLYAVMSRRYGAEAANYLRRAVEQNPRMSATEQGNILSEYILQEIIADLNGGMDEAGQYAERFADELGAFRWETTNEAQRTQTAERADTSSEAAASPAEYAEETDAGGRFSFAGERAQTADKSLLKQAQQMEQSGATPETIWKKTGWGKGADGKWRFEIDDADMQLKKVEYAKMRHTEHGSTRLSDLISHKQMFEHYPHLASLIVSFNDLDGARGQYSRSTQRITLDESLKNNESELKEVLIHELQHAIQDYEDFASGASPEYWQARKEAQNVPLNEGFRKKVADARAKLNEVMNKNPRLFMDVRDLMMSEPSVPRGEVDFETLEEITPDPPEWQEFDRRRDELAEKYGELEVFDAMSLFGKANMSNNRMNDKSAYDLYYNTAGEIEARDASNRSELVAEERREKYPKSMKPDTDRVFAEGSDARFSLSSPIEETKDLIAAHNISESKLSDALELGGLPMPSIAVTKANMGHEDFGSITLLFDKSTIDPEANKANKVYGGDAYTPTFPQVEYKPSQTKIKKLRSLYNEVADKYGYDAARPLYEFTDESNLSDRLNRLGGESEVIDRLKNDTNLMEMFLRLQGQDEIAPVEKEVVNEISEAEKQNFDFLIRKLGKDFFENMTDPAGRSYFAYAKKYFNDNIDKIKNAYKDMYSDLYGFSEEEINNIFKNASNDQLFSEIRECRKYIQTGGKTVKIEMDFEATRNKIKAKADELGYNKWVDTTFKGIAEKKGIRNKKDYYTRSGRPRDFDELHEEYNLDNVVNTMRQQLQRGQSDFATGANSVKAAVVDEYKSIGDIKRAKNKLQNLTETEVDALKSGFNDRLVEFAKRAKQGSEDSVYRYIDDFCETIIEALSKSKTKAAFERNMRAYPDIYKIDDALMQDIEQLLEDMRNAPVKYFEAKPQRAIPFKEVVAAVAPDNTDRSLLQRLQDAGVKQVLTYENSNSADRLEKVNSVPEVRFSKADDIHTPQFKDWFGDWENNPEHASKVVNEDGTPKVVYRGGQNESFTVFDRKKSKYLNLFGRGFYFADRPEVASRYGDVREFYLDIKNPLTPEQNSITKQQLHKFLEAVADNEDYDIHNYGTTDIDEITDKIYGKSDFAMLQDISATAIGDLVEATELFNEVNGTNYDGFILPSETIAFYPAQIKSATDNIGTYDKTNPDIRYSIENLSTQDLLLEIANGISYRDDLINAAKKNRTEVRELINDKKQLQSSLENAKRQMTRTKVPYANAIATGKVTRAVLKSMSSKADVKEIAPRVLEVYNTYFKEMHAAGHVETLENKAAENMALAFQDIAADIIAESTEWTSGEDYRDLMAYLRGTQIKLTDSLKSDVHYNEFRRRNFYMLTLSDNGIPIESLWSELCGLYPHIFDEDIANPADQLEAIENAVEALKPKAYNPTRGHEAEAMDFVIEQFMSEADSVVQKKTKADKAYEKAQKDKEAALEKQRQKFEAENAKRLAEIEAREEKLVRAATEQRWARYWDAEEAKKATERQEYQAYWEKRLAGEKIKAEKRKNAQMKRTVAHKDEVIANIRERRKIATLKAHIRKTANDLSKRLNNPKGAPAKLVKSIAEICAKLDFTTDRAGKGGGENKSNLRLLELRSAYEAIAKDPDYDLVAEGEEVVTDLSNRINQLDNVLEGKKIADLNVQELFDLDGIMKEIRHAVINANKQIASEEKRTNKELGQSVIDQLDQLKNYDRNIISSFLTNYSSQVMNSMRLAEMMSGYDTNSTLYKMFEQLNYGLRKQAKFTMENRKPFDELVNGQGNGRLYQEFSTKLVDTGLKFPNGKPVELPKDMICELIMLWDREQGRSHLERGGFTVPDFNKLNKGDIKGAFEKSRERTVGASYTTDKNGDPVVTAGITEKDIARLRNTLDDYDKLWIARARAFFNGEAQRAVNETSLTLRGRKIATTQNYIPIHTNQNFVASEIKGVKMDATLEGHGSLKSVVDNAPQPLYLMGLAQTVKEHIDFVGKYYGLAIPIRNFNKVYNVTVRDSNGHMDSVKNVLNQKWGSNIVKYGVEQLLTDLQTSRPKASDFVSKMFATIQSNLVAATLNGNISVCIKQAASYPTAMYIVGAKPLAKALAARPKIKHADLLNEIDAHTGLHYLRRIGLSTQELGDRAGSNALVKRVTDKLDAALIDKGVSSSILSSNWIQTVDVATTETLWLAAKYYVEDELNVKPGAKDYWDRVTSTYETIIEETQPNYDVMHRPEIQKTTNAITRSIVMYATQPLQNSGILYSSIGNLAAKNAAVNSAKKAYEQNKTTKNKKAYDAAKMAAGAARARLARAVTGLVTSAIKFTFMSVLSNFVKHSVKRYRDEKDDGKVSIKKVLLSALDDLKNQGITMFVPAIGATAIEFIGLLKDGYDYQIPVTQMFNDTKDAIIKFKKVLNDVNSTSAYLPTNEKLWKFKDAANDLLKIVGEFAGISITNYENIANGVIKYVKDIINHEAFSSDLAEYKPKYVYSYADLAGSIISGDAEKEKKIYQYFEDADRKKENKNGKKEFDKAQLTKYLKPAYVSYVKSNPQEAARIKKNLIDKYGYDGKTIDKWLKDDKEKAAKKK